MVTDALKTIQSSSMEYISESTDVYNNSDRVQGINNNSDRVQGINSSKSDQSEIEPGSITDDCKISN